MPDPDDPRAWMAKAQSDLLCIDNNLHSANVPWDAIANHAQQAAEKMLKACLVYHGAEVPRTHDLGRLLGECLALGITLGQISADCDLLLRLVSRFVTQAMNPTFSKLMPVPQWKRLGASSPQRER